MLSANINGVWRSSVLGGDPSTGPLLSLLGGSPVRSLLSIVWVMTRTRVMTTVLYIWMSLKEAHLLGLSSWVSMLWVMTCTRVMTGVPRTSSTRVPPNLQKGGDM